MALRRAPAEPDLLPFRPPAREWLSRATDAVVKLRTLGRDYSALESSMPTADLDDESLVELWRTCEAPTTAQGCEDIIRRVENFLTQQAFNTAQAVGRVAGHAIAELARRAADAPPEALPRGVVLPAVFRRYSGLLWSGNGSMETAGGLLLGRLSCLPPGHPYLGVLPDSEVYRYPRHDGTPVLVLGYGQHAIIADEGWVRGQTLANRAEQLSQHERAEREKRLQKEVEERKLRASDWWVRNRVEELSEQVAALAGAEGQPGLASKVDAILVELADLRGRTAGGAGGVGDK